MFLLFRCLEIFFKLCGLLKVWIFFFNNQILERNQANNGWVQILYNLAPNNTSENDDIYWSCRMEMVKNLSNWMQKNSENVSLISQVFLCTIIQVFGHFTFYKLVPSFSDKCHCYSESGFREFEHSICFYSFFLDSHFILEGRI